MRTASYTSVRVPRPLIYAAGPITGQSYKGATEWYENLRYYLPECEIITPMRGKEWAKDVREFKSGEYKEDYDLGALDAAVSSDNGIVTRDLWDVQRCDLVFANFRQGEAADRVSIGTVAEVTIAGFLRKPVVVVRTQGGVHDHPFLRQAAWVTVDTFLEGALAVRLAFDLGPIGSSRPDCFPECDTIGSDA